MPTGYTADLAKDITFEQFILRCTRAMGVCVTMRDASSGEEIPEKFEPSTYHLEEMERYQNKLIEFNNLTLEEAEERAVSEHEERFADSVESQTSRDQLKIKYDAMLEKVKAWVPPTKDHIGLQDFMIQQIEESIKFDCATYYGEQPRLLSGQEWLNAKIESIADSISYHAKEYAEDIKRVAGRNLWLSQLRDSLK